MLDTQLFLTTHSDSGRKDVLETEGEILLTKENISADDILNILVEKKMIKPIQLFHRA